MYHVFWDFTENEPFTRNDFLQAFALADKADIEIEDQIKVAFKDHTEDKELADQTIDEVRWDLCVTGKPRSYWVWVQKG